MDPEESSPRVRGAIDMLDRHGPLSRAPVLIRGWAVGLASPVSRIEIWLDGRLQGRAALGRVRADGAATPTTEFSGFEFRLDLGRLDGLEESAVLRAQVTLLDGAHAELPRVRIALAPRIASEIQSEPAIGRMIRSESARSIRRPIRLLCVGRSLDYGGSQLRLKEIVQYLQATGEFVCTVVSPIEGPLRREFEAGGVAVYVRPIAIGDLAAYEQQLSGMADWAAERFDLVLAGTLTSFAAIDLAGRLGLPSVWRIGENETVRTVADWLGEPLDPAVALRADQAFDTASVVMFISQSTLRLNWRNGAAGRFAVLRHAIDVTAARAYIRSTDREACREALGIAPDRRVLLCAGTLWPIKGQAGLVAAMQQACIDHPQLECIIVGQHTEPHAGALSRLIDRHGLAPHVRLLSFCGDLRPWWRAVDAAVCPSESETMPASVLEAMAFGLPVLATRVGGIPEVVDDGETGFLCEPNDLGSLVQGLVRLATTESGILRAIGERAAKRIGREYDHAESFRRVADLLRHVARGSRPQWLLDALPGGP
jgi:glycosyltransferase involved in cell wall biosynthesis